MPLMLGVEAVEKPRSQKIIARYVDYFERSMVKLIQNSRSNAFLRLYLGYFNTKLLAGTFSTASLGLYKDMVYFQ